MNHPRKQRVLGASLMLLCQLRQNSGWMVKSGITDTGDCQAMISAASNEQNTQEQQNTVQAELKSENNRSDFEPDELFPD